MKQKEIRVLMVEPGKHPRVTVLQIRSEKLYTGAMSICEKTKFILNLNSKCSMIS